MLILEYFRKSSSELIWRKKGSVNYILAVFISSLKKKRDGLFSVIQIFIYFQSLLFSFVTYVPNAEIQE